MDETPPTKLSTRHKKSQVSDSMDSMNDPVLPTAIEVSLDGTLNPGVKSEEVALPKEIKQCNAELQNARKMLLEAIDREAEAKEKVALEEGKLREMLFALIPNVKEVTEKISNLRKEIENSNSVSSPSFNAFKDAMLEAKARTEALKDLRAKARGLQMRNLALHREYHYLYSAHDTNLRIYSAQELKAVGYTAREMKNGGYTVRALTDAGYTARELKDVGYTARELKDVGYTTRELTDGGYTARELRDGGYTAMESYTGTPYRYNDLRLAGYTESELCGVPGKP
jgi:D-ribose pyranose/furanose isomerase RbsD